MAEQHEWELLRVFWSQPSQLWPLAADAHHRGLCESALCRCGAVETRAHYLLECQLWQDQRSRLLSDLAALGVCGLGPDEVTVGTLLGNDDVVKRREDRLLIAEAVRSFVQRTGRLTDRPQPAPD